MKSSVKFLITGVLSAALVASGITAASASTPGMDTDSTRSASEDAAFDGEVLFRGVVFGQGPAGDVLGELTAQTKLTTEVEGEIDRVVDNIREEDPTFFDEFGERAQSGDVLQVKEAFTDLGQALDTTLQNLGYSDGSNKAVTPACIQVVLFAVAAVVYAGAAILQVAAVAVSVWYAGPKSAQAQAPLSYEKWIAEATVDLASE